MVKSGKSQTIDRSMSNPSIIMVAPNGARKTKEHHPALPVSITETYAMGASAIHAHVRGENGEHVLDAGRYRELVEELKTQVPEMLVQVTTEAVGIYSPRQRADCVKAVKPEMISLAMREMAGVDQDLDFAREFYEWCRGYDVHIQHIMYDDVDMARLLLLQKQNVIPPGRLCVLFVLGRFLENREATPEDIEPFLKLAGEIEMDWFVCAFGSHEQACALSAIEQGGHARIGFENNLYHADGSVADNTAALVASLKTSAIAGGSECADGAAARKILGVVSRV